jgi:cell division protein ZipA
MDKDTLRIIIFLIGLLVVIGMIAWSFYQHQKDLREFEDYDAEQSNHNSTTTKEGYSFGTISSALQKTSKKITEPLKNKIDPISADVNKHESMPELIQLSIIAPTAQGFGGEDIFKVLKSVDLSYGNLQIFERLDSNRLVDFAVANIVNPGVFPQDDLANFYSPGLSFFMQPKKVDHPIEVFEDFIRTFNFVALKLGGEMVDNNRQLLTDERLEDIRQSL